MANTLDNKKDIYWINAVKAFCMIFVYYAHSELYYGFYFKSIYNFYITFYVNSFFFISGYLFFRKQLLTSTINYQIYNNISNILLRIILPSIFFSIIVFFPKFLMRGESFTKTEFFYDTIGGCTFWFTSALVIAEFILLFLLTSRIRNIWFYAIICLFFTCLGNYIYVNDINVVSGTSSFPWHYKQALICMIYIALGGLYWKYELLLKKILSKYVLIALILIYLVAVLFFSDYIKCITSLCEINILGVVVTTIATVLLIEFCKVLPEFNVIKFIGQHTLGYYFLSGAIPNSLSILALKLVPGLHGWMLILIWVLNLCLATICVFIMNRCFPWLFDLRLLKKKK